MKRFLIIAMAAAGLSCASSKQVAELDAQDSLKTELNSQKATLYQAETLVYGDTLQGESFIYLDDLRPFYVESSGQKVEVLLTPVRNPGGDLTGHRVVYKTTAKPKEIRKTVLKQDSTNQVQHSTQQQKKVTERQTEKKGSGFTSGLLGAVLTLFLLLALVIWWVIKR